MRNSKADEIQRWFVYDYIPVTKSILILSILSFFAIVVFKLNILAYLFTFRVYDALTMPWTFFTYPIIPENTSIWIIFSYIWLWFVGSSLERSLGSRKYLFFFLSVTAVFAIALTLGSLVTGISTVARGLWLPLAGLTIAYAMKNPEQTVLFMFVIPLKLKYLALLSVAFIIINFSQQSLLIALFALIGCLYAYIWVLYDRRSYDIVLPRKNILKSIRDYRSKRRLRKFLERSNDL